MKIMIMVIAVVDTICCMMSLSASSFNIFSASIVEGDITSLLVNLKEQRQFFQMVPVSSSTFV